MTGTGAGTGTDEEGQIVARQRGSKTVAGGQALVKWASAEVATGAVSTGLVAAGVTSVLFPVAAVIVVVGHVIIKGVTHLVRKTVQVRAEQKTHLEQLNLTETQAADHFTMVINGNGAVDGQYSAFVSPTDDANYMSVNAGHVKGISKLISGNVKCNVRDMGGFTEGESGPFSVCISMPDVLALMRQSWVYERFCQTKCKTMTVVVLRSQKGNTKLRVAWENSGSIEATKATVYTVSEWKKTPYAGKTKSMREDIADIDMALDKTLVFE